MRSTHHAFRSTAVLAALVLGAVACVDDSNDPVVSGGDTVVGLRGGAPVMLQSGRECDAVLEDFQTFAPEVLEARWSMATDDMAIEESMAAGDAGTAAPTAAPADGDTAGRSAQGGATSDTNTQEQGIDEPDVVETDGDHVYLVDGDALVILDGSSAELLSRTPLSTHGAQLLLEGDRLLAISGGGYGIATDAIVPEAIAPDEGVVEPLPAPEPAPSEPSSFSAGTVLQLIDVSEPARPVIVETTEIEGSHVSTRVVDGVARVVVASYPQPEPLMGAVADGGRGAVAVGVAETTIEDWLPAFRTRAEGAGTVEGALVECEDVFVPEVNAGLAETSVLRVDFEDGFDAGATTTVVAETGTVYASASTLYLAANRYVAPEHQTDVDDAAWSTALHAFDLGGDGAAAHLAAGEVPGQLLNQYSLSEYDGHLRVATTEGVPWNESDPSQSGVRVLRIDGDQLREVGAVTGLGVTETIQSVRFMGPVGYVVTFRQTDPLYVIDLVNPESPQAVGELKIPGFSSYLHPGGEGRLIGIGRDADLEGRDQGLLVSLFDVSDPTSPEQLQTYTQRDAWSAAGHDPKAFLWWAPESALAIPIERYAAAPDGAVTDDRIAPSGQLGIVVLDVGDDGITERATVVAGGRYPSRALVVQGSLWSLFDGGVVVSDFANPAAGSFHSFR